MMTRGKLKLAYGDDEHILEGNWAWPCHPGPFINFRSYNQSKTWHHYYIAFTGPRVVHWESMGLLLQKPQPLPSLELVDRYREMVALAFDISSYAQLKAVALLEYMLIELAEARVLGPVKEELWLADAMQALQEQLSEELDYELLAESLHMSLPTLRRKFKQATGQAIHTYRLQYRIAEARRLLTDGDWPIKRIAEELGYLDVFYFTRQFKQICGVSPGKYRKTIQ